MTSLQQQLAVIAANSTKQLDVKAQRSAHAKSLLFEPKIAVSQNYDVLFQICREGFDELCLLDPRFNLFAGTLFSEQSKSEEREQMTAAQNTELDNAIKSFLDLAASKILLKPGLKAIEWLIRRFKIHEYNLEHVILVFLPYHTTTVFLNLLAILPSRVSPTFKFLKPYIVAQSHPPIHAIIYAATNTPSFFVALNRQVIASSQAGYASSELIRFWTVVVSQAIDGMLTTAQSGVANIKRDRVEAVLLQILPVLDDAFQLADVPDMEIAACMIITILAARGNLSDTIKARFMEAITSTWTPVTVDARLICLVALTQETVPKRLPKRVAKKLISTTELISRLQTISKSYRASNLIIALCQYCIGRLDRAEIQQELNLLVSILSEDLLNQKELVSVLQSFAARSATLSPEEVNAAQQDSHNFERLRSLFRNPVHQILSSLKHIPAQPELQALQNLLQVPLISLNSVEDEIESHTTAVQPMLTVHQPQSLNLDSLGQPSRSCLASWDDSVTAIVIQSILASNGASSLSLVVSHSSFKQDSTKDGSVFYTSLLTRLACSIQMATSVRIQALELLRRAVETLLGAGYDVQNIIPYLLVLLGDQSAKIRKVAMYILQDISNCGQAGSAVWGTQLLYDSESAESVLSNDEISSLLKDIILISSNEILADAMVLSKILTAHMTTKQSSKKKQKASICNFLAWHTASTSLCNIQTHLLNLLSQFGRIAVTARSSIAVSGLKRWAALNVDQAVIICGDQNCDLTTVNTSLLKAVLPGSAENLLLLESLISGSNVRLDIVHASHIRLREIWRDIPETARGVILQQLIGLSLQDPKNERQIRDTANETLRSLPLQNEDLSRLLQLPSLPSSKTATINRHKAKNSQSQAPQAMSSEVIDILRKYTRSLELIESTSGMDGEVRTELLLHLFRILGELQSFGMYTDSSLIYLKSLTINALLVAVERLIKSQTQLDLSSTFRIDLIVDTIANTSNIQLQQSCLLLIANLATLIPEVVLHSVMPIFTLMGSTILRQADDFSAHVIRQTISHIIPPLVQSLKLRSKDMLSSLTDILTSFTVAFEHIPMHRRLDTYTQVVNALGVDDSMFILASLIRLRYPTDNNGKQIITQLIRSFSPDVMIKTLQHIVDLIADMFSQKQSVSDVLLHVKDLGESECSSTAIVLLDMLTDLVNDSLIRASFIQSMQFESSNAASQQAAFSQLMGSSIQLVQHLRGTVCEKAANIMLGGILGLLPLEELVTCAQMLLDGASIEVRNVVIRAVANKVKSLKQVGKTDSLALLSLLPTLDTVIDQANFDEDKAHAIQCSLNIAEKVGRTDITALIDLVTRLLGSQCLACQSANIQVQCLNALAKLVVLLQDALLSQVPKILKRSFDLLRLSIETSNVNQDLIVAVFNLLSVICQQIPIALAGESLDEAIQLAQQCIDTSSTSVPAQDKFYQIVVHHVPAPEIIPALNRNFGSVYKSQGFDAIVQYYKLVKNVVTHQNKSVVLKQSNALLKFVKQALDLRATSTLSPEATSLSKSEIEELELLAIDITLSVVLKLNDGVFRPFFIQLVDDAVFKSGQPSETQIARAFSLFSLVQSLLHRLGNLVVSYMSYVIDLASHIITLRKDDAVKLEDLILNTLGALRQSFTVDSDEYWHSPSRFTSIKSPVIALLAYQTSGQARSQVIATITAFASASGSTDNFKAINSEILPLFRSTKAAIRLAAVQCQRSLTDALGEDWLVLLPEMLPLITELLEDDDEKIERETRLWIKDIEEMVGESLDSMLQ